MFWSRRHVGLRGRGCRCRVCRQVTAGGAVCQRSAGRATQTEGLERRSVKLAQPKERERVADQPVNNAVVVVGLNRSTKFSLQQIKALQLVVSKHINDLQCSS